MLVVASSGGRGGISRAMATLRQGGSALDAVVAGIGQAERERDNGPADSYPLGLPKHLSSGCAVASLPGGGAESLPVAWGRWRRQLTEELRVEPVALARMEWLVGLGAAAIGPASPAEAFSLIACGHARDIACGVSVGEHGGAARRIVLALRAGRSLGDALHEVLADSDTLGMSLFERVNIHALARDRIPLGSSHRMGETFLYMRPEMADYAERACLYVAWRADSDERPCGVRPAASKRHLQPASGCADPRGEAAWDG